MPNTDDEDTSWVDTPFVPFKTGLNHDKPTPRLPIVPLKVWQCVDCKSWQLDGEPCQKCAKPSC
jgi:hypothetical protein